MRLLYNFDTLSTDRIEIFRLRDRPWMVQPFRNLSLCGDDREELALVNPGESAEESLFYCMTQENSYGVLFDGTPSLLFGFAPYDHVCFIPWLLSDGRIQKHCPKEFLRLARKIVNKVRATGIPMYNCVPAETRRSMEWLERLGFLINPEPVRSSDGVPVRVFSMNATTEG